MAAETSYSDIYRFAAVRAISAYQAEALRKRFIILENDSSIAPFKARYPNSLFFKLNELNDYSRGRLSVLIAAERMNSKLILSFEEIAKVSSGIEEFFKGPWDTTSIAQLKQRIHEALGGEGANPDDTLNGVVNADGFSERKFLLYETLASLYLVPEPPELLDMVQNYIRILWICQRLVKPDKEFAFGLDDDPKLIEQAAKATLVLPVKKKSAPDEMAQPPEIPPVDPAPDVKARQRLLQLSSAEADLNQAADAQKIDNDHLPKCVSSSPPPNPVVALPTPAASLLARRYVDRLTQSTHDVIDSLHIAKESGVDVAHVLARIKSERNSLLAKNFSIPLDRVVINLNGRFIEAPPACIPYKYNPCAQFAMLPIEYRKTPLRGVGWADLKVIRTTLLKYDKGEIAHIENVLKGEIKVRKYNVTTRTEDTRTTDEETTAETQQELESTDRFEVEREVASQIKEDSKFDTGVKVSATLGSVQLDTHLDFAYNTSKEESNKTSTKSAQEVVNRALNKVIERKRAQRTVSTIITTEDINEHTLKNDEAAADNIHGTYFWVDKYYLAKVVNYGSRYMLEFIVPEPASFFLYSKINKPQPENAKVKPQFPQVLDSLGRLKKLTSHLDISEDNYAMLAAQYEAIDITPPYPETIVITDTVEVKKNEDEITASDRNGGQIKFTQAAISSKSLTVNDGYEPQTGWVTVSGWADSNVTIQLGNVKRSGVDFGYTQLFSLNNELKIVPFSVWAYNTGGLVCNVEILCALSDTKREEWRIKTYNSILTAYRKQLTDYEDWQKEQTINAGITIQGDNPEINRRIEKEELKKFCIELMTGQFFEAFNAVNSNVSPLGYPELVPDSAFEQGKHIQFFEQAFEWEQITYVFYPYFWGRKPNWVMINNINDSDPLFTSFLQAGAARVLVPTRPGFEDSVNYFLTTRRIWNGKNPPIPGEKMWISVVDELKAQENQFDGGQQDGIPWIYKVPTSLVYLEKTAFTLPDTDKSADFPNDLKQIDDAKTTADFS